MEDLQDIFNKIPKKFHEGGEHPPFETSNSEDDAQMKQIKDYTQSKLELVKQQYCEELKKLRDEYEMDKEEKGSSPTTRGFQKWLPEGYTKNMLHTHPLQGKGDSERKSITSDSRFVTANSGDAEQIKALKDYIQLQLEIIKKEFCEDLNKLRAEFVTGREGQVSTPMNRFQVFQKSFRKWHTKYVTPLNCLRFLIFIIFMLAAYIQYFRVPDEYQMTIHRFFLYLFIAKMIWNFVCICT